MNYHLPDDTADFELSLTPQHDHFDLYMRLRRPGDAGDLQRGPFIVTLDFVALRGLTFDPLAYGATLRDALFADPEARTMFAEARAASLDIGRRLRVRLRVPPELHLLRWEMLLDPRSGRQLALESNLLLTRHLDSDEYQSVHLRPRGHVRALVAVATASNLSDYRLASIDARTEITRVRAALTGIRVDTLGDDVPCTLAALGERLRVGDGVDILYLIAHGAFIHGAAKLYLAGTDTKVVVADGSMLADLLRSLDERRPRLVVLASCESAGDGLAATLATLAPQLALAGVPAVVAMQGRISMETIKGFAPVFFSELLRDGLADRALAMARQAVRERTDWWLPVLYTRLREGRIWALPKDTTVVPPGLASPYRALDAFTMGDAALFFGRDALIEEGYQRWEASDRRFLAVVGASGSGKSSLAMAGLLPRFQRDLDEPQRLSYCAPVNTPCVPCAMPSVAREYVCYTILLSDWRVSRSCC